jgi:hypothetical protein
MTMHTDEVCRLAQHKGGSFLAWRYEPAPTSSSPTSRIGADWPSR